MPRSSFQQRANAIPSLTTPHLRPASTGGLADDSRQAAKHEALSRRAAPGSPRAVRARLHSHAAPPRSGPQAPPTGEVAHIAPLSCSLQAEKTEDVEHRALQALTGQATRAAADVARPMCCDDERAGRPAEVAFESGCVSPDPRYENGQAARAWPLLKVPSLTEPSLASRGEATPQISLGLNTKPCPRCNVGRADNELEQVLETTQGSSSDAGCGYARTSNNRMAATAHNLPNRAKGLLDLNEGLASLTYAEPQVVAELAGLSHTLLALPEERPARLFRAVGVQATSASIVSRGGLDAGMSLHEGYKPPNDSDRLMVDASGLAVPMGDADIAHKLQNASDHSDASHVPIDKPMEDDPVAKGIEETAMTGVNAQGRSTSDRICEVSALRSVTCDLRYPVICPEPPLRPAAFFRKPSSLLDGRAALVQALGIAVAMEVDELRRKWVPSDSNGSRRGEEKLASRLMTIARRAQRKCIASVLTAQGQVTSSLSMPSAFSTADDVGGVEEVCQLEARCTQLEEENTQADERLARLRTLKARSVREEKGESEAAVTVENMPVAAVVDMKCRALKNLQVNALTQQLARRRLYNIEASQKFLAEREDDIKIRGWGHLPGGQADGLVALATIM